jgi:ribosomal protein L37AE/L43A
MKKKERIEYLELALKDMLKYYDRETCQHEDTHRGGAIWTICDGCGRKWADDEGGFVPYSEPLFVSCARQVFEGKI